MAEETKPRRKRKEPTVNVTVVGSWKDRPMYERVMHWKPHIEMMYRLLGYGNVTVSPTQEAIDEYNKLKEMQEV